jgi:hypothetical protein
MTDTESQVWNVLTHTPFGTVPTIQQMLDVYRHGVEEATQGIFVFWIAFANYATIVDAESAEKEFRTTMPNTYMPHTDRTRAMFADFADALRT